MNRRFAMTLLTVLTAICCAIGLVACGGEASGGSSEPSHTHTFATEWSNNDTHHWHAATCEHRDEVKDKAAHTMHGDTCSVCSYRAPTEGLAYELSVDGNTYTCMGIGTATATEIVIAPVYEGKPVTSIGPWAFRDCISLTSVIIPDSVTSIGDHAFYNTAYYNDEHNWENDVLYIGRHLIKANATLSGTYSIKEGTLTIAEDAFYGCSLLTSVVIPDGVTSIGQCTFANCTSLTSVTIPDSVKSIGEEAFDHCTSLASVTLPDSVKSIGYLAFNNCTSLPSITIPAGVTNIEGSAFNHCESIAVAEGNITYHSDGNCIVETASKTLISGCKGSVIPTDGSVTSIGEYAFANCTSFSSIVLPDSVTNIGDYAFVDCSSLTSVTIPDSVKSIGERAFYHTAYYNDEHNWENGVLYIGNRLIEAKNTISGTYSIREGTLTIADDAFYRCTSLSSVIIPDSVTRIGNYAFSQCTSLASVIIPDSVTNIGEKTFDHCTALNSVYYGGTEQQWNDIAIDLKNPDLTNATRYYYSETEPTTEGNHWHYDTDGKTPVIWTKKVA